MPHHDHALALGSLFDGFGLPATLFLAGLAGGFTHCAGMCGPFVLAQVAGRLGAGASGPDLLARLRGGALIPYHLGRAATYAGLGAAAGGLSGEIAALGEARWLAAAFLLLAAILFVAPALGVALARPPRVAAAAGAALARLVAPLLAAPGAGRGVLTGVALGFLPCGLLYGALAAAAGGGSAGRGAAAMAAFTLGTAPALIAVGCAGASLGRRYPMATRRVGAALMVLNGVALTVLAARALA